MHGTLARFAFVLVSALSPLLSAPPAFAEGDPCFNDTDCPGSACGSEVCNWNKFAANPIGDKAFYCQPAGLAPQGVDGWCTTDADCKCRPLGAKCIGVYCSFTQAESIDPAPGVGGSAAAGGPSRGGSPAAAGAQSSAGTATTRPPSEDDQTASPLRESRACSVGPVPARQGVALSLALLAVASAVARRRGDRYRT